MSGLSRLIINAPWWRMPQMNGQSSRQSHRICPQQSLYFSWPETHQLGWNVPSYWRC